MTIKERPIMFSALMVRAILEGRKSQTRRVIKGGVAQTCSHCGEPWPDLCDRGTARTSPLVACPYGVPGDRLWVKETAIYWRYSDGSIGGNLPVVYQDEEDWDGVRRDSKKQPPYELTDDRGWWRFLPSIHMPRWASRLTLEVKAVRVERVQAISSRDAKAEGIAEPRYGEGRYCSWVDPFRDLWDSINGKSHPWASNPWVWVVEFERVNESRRDAGETER